MQQLVYPELLIRHPATNQTSNGSQKTDLRVLGTPATLYWIASKMCAFCIVLFLAGYVSGFVALLGEFYCKARRS